jgi:L-asparaginase
MLPQKNKTTYIKIVTTGGTIDKVYFDAKSTYEVGPPNIEMIFNELSLAFDYEVVSLMKKDSLDLTTEDRRVIYEAVATDRVDKIIITHGTDTMVETACQLSGIQGKTIVMTGALKPALFRTTDAVFNIGCAVAAVQTLHSGVYIAMNGRIFPHDNVKKDMLSGKFVTIK